MPDQEGSAPDLVAEFGSAKHPERPVAKTRPDGVSDALVDALGKLSAALEVAENARGHLYEFHRLSGNADISLQGAVSALRDAGQAAVADQIEESLVGRDVIPGRWTFQLVEAYDDTYVSVFRGVEQRVREHLAGGVRHLYEAEMKFAEQNSSIS
ncbi:MAG: hypothetical protein JWN95_1629 [Frankiales bacterium]|nr:hypothetical protein [Frankiales bacterium]